MLGVVTTSYPRDADDSAGAFVKAKPRAQPFQVIAAGARDESAVGVVRVAAPPGIFDGAGAPEALEQGGAPVLLGAALFGARLIAAVAAHARHWSAVESHWLVPSALAVAAAAPGLPHRAHAHGGDVALLERLPLGGSIARFLLGSGATLVFVTADLRDRFAALCGVPASALRAHVEPAPVDERTFQPRTPASRARLRAELGLTGPTVLAVGRLVPVKGLDLAVRALGRLSRAGRPALVIAGEGPERPRLTALAARRGVDLRLLGQVPPRAVAAWMGAADLFVHPSRMLPGGRGEGMPVALREALAVGLPVVAADLGGIRELSGAPHLTLFPPDDADALARVITATFGAQRAA